MTAFRIRGKSSGGIMAPESGGVEQAVSRALRDNLDRLQRMSDELHQAVADLVAACASSRPANALPPMLRAQTTAASLAAALDVLSRFVASALQPLRPPAENEPIHVLGVQPPETPQWQPPPPPTTPVPMGDSRWSAPAEHAPALPAAAVGVAEPEPAPAPMQPVGAFDLASLSPEEQEMHRRANRVAKVSMQDIKLLRPEQVGLGREQRDICTRLRDDIEKARREYDRRFRPILDHPVDYFYSWMVEILADGDPEALGEYPYSSSVLRR